MTYPPQKLKFWHYLQGGFLYRIHGSRLRKAIKILISVVIGVLLMGGLYLLFDSIIMPTLSEKITALFNYNG